VRVVSQSWLGRERATGLRTVAGWKTERIDTVISLLERDEVEELGLGPEAGLCSREGMEFVSFPIADRGVPESRPLPEIL